MRRNVELEANKEVLVPNEMVLITTGETKIGSTDFEIDWIMSKFQHHQRSWYEDETPQIPIKISSFLMDKYPVTNQDFQSFVTNTGYVTTAEVRGFGLVYTDEYWQEVSNACWINPSGHGTGISDVLDHPVVHISLRDAQAYAEWANKRLPSEQEWVRAAKGGNDYLWVWGNNWDHSNINSIEHWIQEDEVTIAIWKAWWKEKFRETGGMPLTTRVGSFQKNRSEFGVFDLCGNVYEILSSTYEKYDKSKTYFDMYEQIFGKYITVKGGSWMNFKYQSRCNERIAIDREYSSFATGFRCAKDINE